MTRKEHAANKSVPKLPQVRPASPKPSGEIHPEDLEQAIQRARSRPTMLSNRDIAVLQRTIGNQAVGQLMPSKSPIAHSKITISQHGPGTGSQI